MGTKDKTIPLLPLNGRIIILPEEKQKVTASGLYLADTSSSSEKSKRGIVIKLGIEKIDDNGNKVPFNVKVGQSVLFDKYAGEELEFDGQKYLMVREDEI